MKNRFRGAKLRISDEGGEDIHTKQKHYSTTIIRDTLLISIMSFY